MASPLKGPPCLHRVTRACRGAVAPFHAPRRGAAGAVGLAAAAGVGATTGVASAATRSATDNRAAGGSEHPAAAAAGAPLVVYLRDAASGELDIFAGTNHTVIRDQALVARLTNAVQVTGSPQLSHPHRQKRVSYVVAPRSAGDLEGPGRRQHRRLRVRQPGRARHRHDHRQLHPAAGPGGGPNFYEFGDDVLYSINIDNDGDGQADISTSSGSRPRCATPNTFLYNTGPIASLTARTGTGASPTRSPASSTATAPAMLGVEPRPARRATSGRCRPRTTPASPRRRCTLLGAA